ncbi:hypothetical protein T4C_11575 [Trichinella pseudospiralis]|uniref:Uncharacterized protein n=3 Tax=Trichinella pseudospiralis TaxID=6337 RepID=A0A0V1ISF2_TRIPS|nr:hypothetical protein T4C_11575 [Trichinella pseudospiralis]
MVHRCRCAVPGATRAQLFTENSTGPDIKCAQLCGKFSNSNRQKETEKLSLELQGKADQWRIDFGNKPRAYKLKNKDSEQERRMHSNYEKTALDLSNMLAQLLGGNFNMQYKHWDRVGRKTAALEAIAKGNFKNHVQLLSKMPDEIAKVFLEEIGSGNMLCAAVEENGMGQNHTCECSNAHYKYDRAL